MLFLLSVVEALFPQKLCLSTRQAACHASGSLVLRFLETAAVVGESFGVQKRPSRRWPRTFTAKTLSHRRGRELRPAFRQATRVGVTFRRRGTLRCARQGISSVVQA